MTIKVNDNNMTSRNTTKDLNHLRTTSPSFTVQSSSKHFTKKSFAKSTSYLHKISTTDQTGDLASKSYYYFQFSFILILFERYDQS